MLKGFLSDRVGAEECGLPRTGSARRESYKYAPVSRIAHVKELHYPEKVQIYGDWQGFLPDVWWWE